MKVQLLGAHNIISDGTGCISILIDDVLAIDAGTLAASLSFAAQQKLRAVLLTHQHYDHVRDIPALGMNFMLYESTLDLYAIPATFEALKAHLLNDILYPDFTQRPPQKPSLRLVEVEPGRAETIAGYGVLPVAVDHAVPASGFQVTSPDGKKVFYTSDTGPGLADSWRQVRPDLLIIEVTALNKYIDFARQSGHLTPSLLQEELEGFIEINGYLPQVVTVHMNPLDEKGIRAELGVVARALKTNIRFGHEGMRIDL
jgi:ribonuclease BN (tRNA processing enzyme)